MRDVFSNRTRIALACNNLAIDIVLKSGTQGSGHACSK